MVETAKKPVVKKAAATAPKKVAAAPAKSGKKIKVTQIGSTIGRIDVQRATLVGLGLNKVGRTSTLEDTPSVRGMIAKLAHMVEVVE